MVAAPESTNTKSAADMANTMRGTSIGLNYASVLGRRQSLRWNLVHLGIIAKTFLLLAITVRNNKKRRSKVYSTVLPLFAALGVITAVCTYTTYTHSIYRRKYMENVCLCVF